VGDEVGAAVGVVVGAVVSVGVGAVVGLDSDCLEAKHAHAG
jgi:hypothetical protein